MKNFIFQLTACFLAVVPIHASVEMSVGNNYRKVEIQAGDTGYIFNLESNEKGELSEIKVKWKEAENTYAAKDFGKINSPYMQGIDITAVFPDGRAADKPQTTVMLYIPYHRATVELGDDEYEVIDIIIITFSSGKLVTWTKAENDPNKPTNWKITSSEENVITESVEVSKNNPYSRFVIGKESPQ